MTGFKLATIRTSEGPRAALIVNGTVIEIARQTSSRTHETVLGLLEEGDSVLGKLGEIARLAEKVGMPLNEADLLAPIPLPPAIYAAGSNYADHAAEMAKAAGREPPTDPRARGLRSWHFLKSSRSVVGPDVTIPMPAHTAKLDWEAELAVVIGRSARNVMPADALDFVAGYSIANDLSARDLSRRQGLPDTSSFRHDWLSHKSFDGACPFGPWITLASDIADPHDLPITLKLNGVTKQNSNTKFMIFDIREQIADLSARMTLHPGDIILTGTPAGVGRGSGEFLKAGDVVEVKIGGLGVLLTRFD